MKNFCFAFCIALIICVNHAFGSEVGMPQLDPEFWTAQIFWLILIFSSLYLIIWKVFLPRITYSIENRKSRVVNDLDEAQKLKDNAEKKLKEYNEIIEKTKKEAKKIIDDNKKKLNKDIESKKQKFNFEIEKELIAAEKEIKDLKKASTSNIADIAIETSAELMKQILNTEVNKSNVSAIVNDITKKEIKKHI
jgi:F-type H+-transporting ATPase subunit b|tara:strand:+ start:983 stop:1561 length:579 start_codon:yes stop_codon:yes gene_type:complete